MQEKSEIASVQDSISTIFCYGESLCRFCKPGCIIFFLKISLMRSLTFYTLLDFFSCICRYFTVKLLRKPKDKCLHHLLSETQTFTAHRISSKTINLPLALLYIVIVSTSGCSSWYGCQSAPYHPPPSGLNKQLWAKIFSAPHFLNGQIRRGDGL